MAGTGNIVRLSPTMDIYRGGSVIASVPITPASRRTWKLMEADCITLEFNLSEPLEVGGSRDAFRIGDYINDEIFGRFYITEEPNPADYNPDTGAYSYRLQFDREYIGWKNKMNMLTYTEGGSIHRRETDWTLTDNLEGHARIITENLAALGQTYTYEISADNSSVAAQISYNGASILDSLNAICEAYNCEWWVVGSVIHFGTCKVGTPVTLTLGDNVETATPTPDENQYANRIYAYGSTQNVPETYRENLVFSVDQIRQGDGAFRDSARLITSKNMGIAQDIELPRNSQISVDGKTLQTNFQMATPLPGTYHFKFNFALTVSIMSGLTKPNPRVSLSGAGITWSKQVITIKVPPTTPGLEWNCRIEVEAEGDTFINTQPYNVSLVVTSEFQISSYVYYTGIYSALPNYVKTPLVLTYEGTDYQGYLNYVPNADNTNKDWISCESLDGVIQVGDTFTIKESSEAEGGLEITTIPNSWFTDTLGDPNNLRQIGAKRLMLPEGTNYIGDDTLPLEQVVEKEVIFDDIYPRCGLRISALEKRPSGMEVHYSDGSVGRFNVPVFTIEAERITPDGDVEFPFKSAFLTTEPLKIKFITPSDEIKYSDGQTHGASDGYQLAGMTFDVEFNRGKYTIIPNGDFGNTLPSDGLYPKVGDPFVLLNWNVRALEGLGLIDNAEQELLDTATDYAAALKDVAFNFDCGMMSDWAYTFGVPDMGASVNMVHGALAEAKSTRVIGYELKLDRPWDTPRWTIGDAGAKSRLKEIERRILGIQNASASGAVSASSGSGGISGDLVVHTSEELMPGASFDPVSTSDVFNAYTVWDVWRRMDNYLPLSGGTMTGDIVAQTILPSGFATIGAPNNVWSAIHAENIYLDDTLNAAEINCGDLLVDHIGSNLANAISLTNSIIPDGSLIELGSTANPFHDIYTEKVTFETGVSLYGDGHGNLVSSADLVKVNAFYTDEIDIKSIGNITSDQTGHDLEIKASNGLTLLAQGITLGAALVTSDGSIIPSADNTKSLGSSQKYWKEIFVGDAYISTELNCQAPAYFGSTVDFQGATVINLPPVPSEWYNLKLDKPKESTPAATLSGMRAIIENYSSVLTNSSVYRMVLLRWRRNSNNRSNSWHAPFLTKKVQENPGGYDDNAYLDDPSASPMEIGDTSWGIAGSRVLFLSTSPDNHLNDIIVKGVYQSHNQTFMWKNTHNKKMRVGCAIFKKTGKGHWGWERISNIAEFELYLLDSGTTVQTPNYMISTKV